MITDFTNWGLHNTQLKKLLAALPGNKKILLVVSSLRPDEIISVLQQHQDYDTILLGNTDVWRYRYHNELLDFFKSNESKKFYIQHLGYNNLEILPNTWELSFNTFFYSKIPTDFEIKSQDTKYGFGCLNRNSKFHRTWLAYQLWHNQVIDNTIFSIKDITEGTDFLKEKLQSLSGWKEFEKLIPITFPGTDNGECNDHSVSHVAYSTFCNIVTESEIEYQGHDSTTPLEIATEKTWKPFLSCQIPIFYTGIGQLQYLKGLGFEVFEEMLPIGYDHMNSFDKAQAIVDIVARGRDWISNFYKSNIDKVKYNHELITSDKIEKLMLDQVIDFVYN